MTIPQGIEVGRVDVTFDIRTGKKLLGTLQVSKGSLDWRPARRSANVCSVSWEDFDEWMRNEQ